MKNDKQYNVSEIVNSLSGNFTEDAIPLIHSYFNKLYEKLEHSGVPQTKQNFILKGLYYFVNEYIEDHTNKNSIISFETTLEILNEIGSPTDVIQTLSITKDTQVIDTSKDNQTVREPINKSALESQYKEEQQIVCKHCYTSNNRSSSYCENCGRNFSYQLDFPQNLKQEIIDHNYFVVFMVSWFCLAIFQILFYASFGTSVFSLIFPDIHFRSWEIPFPEDLVFSMTFSSLPAFPITIFIGFFLDELLLNKLKSPKQKYNQAIENLQSRFILGIWLTFTGIIIFSFLVVNEFIEFFPLLLVLLMIYGASFLNHFFLGGKPNNVPYFKLLGTKKTLDSHVKEKYFIFNPIVLFLSAILVTLWAILSNIFLHPEIQIQELPLIGGLILVAAILIFNGLFFLYFYNWSNINKFIYREMLKKDEPPLNQ